MTAEYYVLRLYRRPENGADEVLGTLEDADSGTRWSFKGDDELRRLIDELMHPDKVQTNND